MLLVSANLELWAHRSRTPANRAPYRPVIASALAGDDQGIAHAGRV